MSKAFFNKLTHKLNPGNLMSLLCRSSCPEVFCKKGFRRNFAKFTRKHLCQGLFFNKVAGKETLAQVFSCEFCKISRNNFSYRTPPVAASSSDILAIQLLIHLLKLPVETFSIGSLVATRLFLRTETCAFVLLEPILTPRQNSK